MIVVSGSLSPALHLYATPLTRACRTPLCWTPLAMVEHSAAFANGNVAR